MLELPWNKNTNYRRWSKNNITFEKNATTWQRKHVDEERRESIWCCNGACDGAEVCEFADTFLLEKPNDQIKYIHTESNHHPNIIKHIPASIENYLLNPSSNEILFQESTKHYKDNLHQSGCNKNLTYKPTDTNHQKHSKQKTKIMCFSPPFPIKDSTKIRKYFFYISQRTTFIIAYSIEAKSK